MRLLPNERDALSSVSVVSAISAIARLRSSSSVDFSRMSASSSERDCSLFKGVYVSTSISMQRVHLAIKPVLQILGYFYDNKTNLISGLPLPKRSDNTRRLSYPFRRLAAKLFAELLRKPHVFCRDCACLGQKGGRDLSVITILAVSAVSAISISRSSYTFRPLKSASTFQTLFK